MFFFYFECVRSDYFIWIFIIDILLINYNFPFEKSNLPVKMISSRHVINFEGASLKDR